MSFEDLAYRNPPKSGRDEVVVRIERIVQGMEADKLKAMMVGNYQEAKRCKWEAHGIRKVLSWLSHGQPSVEDIVDRCQAEVATLHNERKRHAKEGCPDNAEAHRMQAKGVQRAMEILECVLIFVRGRSC